MQDQKSGTQTTLADKIDAHEKAIRLLAKEHGITTRMVAAGYEAARELLPIDLRPPHGPISTNALMLIVSAAHRAMEVARAK